MGIRIQPQEIEVPEDDPFKNDLLGRKEPVEILTHLVGSIEGPCVLAVDAAWGTGKTTFLRIWAQYLKNQDFPVIEFNAWETDFTGDPFVALSSELTDGLSEYTDDPLPEKVAAAKNAAKEVLQRAVPGIIRVATAGILDVSPLMEKEVGQFLASHAQERLAGYQEARKSVQNFRTVLQDMASTLATANQSRPLVVVIDELDRCRPSYAVELLEVAKHLFSVDHIVFVLAINRSELAHSIRSLYGSNFDGDGYLRRFFDIDFQLPNPGREKFINALLDAIQINQYIKRTQDRQGQLDTEDAFNLLRIFLSKSDFSLRIIAQAIHRLGLMLASLRSDRPSFVIMIVVVLILRMSDSDLLYRFVRGEVSDEGIADALSNQPWTKMLHQTDEWGLLMAAIIVGAYQIRMQSAHLQQYEEISERKVLSTLWTRYEVLATQKNSDNSTTDPDQQHAKKVSGTVHNFLRIHWSKIGFTQSVQRLELLSPDLMDEETQRT